MTLPASDTFVFFGATGDLAYKKIFPALQAMVLNKELEVPVIGVARAAGCTNWSRRRSSSPANGVTQRTHTPRSGRQM